MVDNTKFSKLSIVIPAYYQKEFDLRSFIKKLDFQLLKIAFDYEIIIVCSNQIRNLYNQAEHLASDSSRICLVTHDAKIGREYAYFLEGADKATSDYVLFIDPFSKLS